MGKRSSQSKSMSTLSPAQNQLLTTSSNWLNSRIGTGATPYSGQLVADLPSYLTDAIKNIPAQLNSAYNQSMQTINDLMSWTPYKSNITQVSKDYNRLVTLPVTQAINKSLGLDTLKSMNQPGSFWSTDVRDKVAQTVSTQVAAQTAPGLAAAVESERQRGFTSNENAPNVKLGIASALTQAPSALFSGLSQIGSVEQSWNQQKLAAAQQEALRLAPENDPYIRLAQGFMTPTQQNFWQPGTDYTALALQGAAQVGGMAIGGYMMGGKGGGGYTKEGLATIARY